MKQTGTITIWPGYTAAMLAGVLVGSIGAGLQWGLGAGLLVGGLGTAGLILALIAVVMLCGTALGRSAMSRKIDAVA